MGTTISPLANQADPIRIRVPFVTTSFVRNILYYALLWPLWWVLGIEQILLPFFLIFELIRFLLRSNWQVRINTTGLFALALAIWWFAPLLWLDRNYLDIFLKDIATIWSQAIFLILVINCVKTRADWQNLVKALTIMAAYMAMAGAIYLSGIWRGSFTSAFGLILPSSLVESSVFFKSIAIRSFGDLSIGQEGLLPFRIRGFSLTFSSLSMLCLILIPFSFWQAKVSSGLYRSLLTAITIGLLLCLIFTESRIAYVALAVAILFYWALHAGILRKRYLLLTIGLALAITGIILLLVYLLQKPIYNAFEGFFIDLRPASFIERLNIYVVTLRLLPVHPIAGWGVPVRITGTSNAYSAGTHSSLLGMFFQHGIVGMILYIMLWLSLWKQAIRGMREKHNDRFLASFWIVVATSFLAFNIRELADSWWWDQSLMFIVWIFWGMVITAKESLAPPMAS